MLADISEDQVGRDRGGLVEADLAPFALDVVFLGEGEAAIGRECRLGGIPSCFGRQELGDVRVLAAGQAGLAIG